MQLYENLSTITNNISRISTANYIVQILFQIIFGGDDIYVGGVSQGEVGLSVNAATARSSRSTIPYL